MSGERAESAVPSVAEVAAALGAVSTFAPKTAKRSMYAWLAFAAAALAILAVWLGPRLRRASRPTGAIEAVAVLPFENRSTESDQEFFADGMTEQLITDLSRIRALRVIRAHQACDIAEHRSRFRRLPGSLAPMCSSSGRSCGPRTRFESRRS